jgi:hypothetical protein
VKTPKVSRDLIPPGPFRASRRPKIGCLAM